MLPFTTYHIPESEQNQTATTDKWLLFAVPKPLTATGKDLLQKISTALKADFEANVLLLEIESGQPVSLSDVHGVKVDLIIGFGVPPGELGIWIDLDQHGVRQLEAFTYIYTLSPDKLAEHAVAKKDLWRQMQMFLELKAEHAR